MTQATRSTLMSVDSTLSENITAAQDYIPIASTTNFSTSVVAEIETTNEVVSFTDISANLVLYSQEITSWSNDNGVTLTANSTTAPDGTVTADSMSDDNDGSATNRIFWENSLWTSASTTYTLSCYAKENLNGIFNICVRGGGAFNALAMFNVSTGVVVTTAAVGSGYAVTSTSITSVGSGWYRCVMTATVGSTITNGRVQIGPSDGASSLQSAGYSNYVGSGNTGVYLWGIQLEEAGAPTTYLPTTTAGLVGLTDVTRGVNGTTATLASSGDAIQQLPYALSEVDMPIRLTGISVTSDGTGAGRFTLCDKIGTTLCDIDIPDTRIYDLSFGGGILFPNGIYVSNSDNITAYTLYTNKYAGAAL